MADNINTNTMVGKVIAVLIALLFVTVLAFPIANSLSNMGKDDDGGGAEPITYTNTGDFYYKSATADALEHTLKIQTSPGSTESTLKFAVLSDNESVYETEFTIPGDDGVLPTSDSILLAVCKDAESGVNTYLTLSNMYAVSIYTELDGRGGVEPVLDPEVDDSGNMYWLFTIQNGRITQTSNGDSMTFDCSSYLSATGEYVLANAPIKVAPNNEILAFGTTIVDDSAHSTEWACATYSSFDAIMLENGNNTVSLVSQNEYVNETTATLSCTVTDVITVNSMSVDVSMNIESRDGTYQLTVTSDNLNLLVPVTVTVGSDEPVTYTNSGTVYARADADSSTHSMEVTLERYGNPIVKVDGHTTGMPITFTYLVLGIFESIFAIAKDGSYLYTDGGGGLYWYNMGDTSHAVVTATSVSGGISTFEFEISNGVMTWMGHDNSTEEPTEHTTELLYYLSSDGDYVCAPVGTPPHSEQNEYVKVADKDMNVDIFSVEYVEMGNSDMWYPVVIFGQFDTSLLISDSTVLDVAMLSDYDETYTVTAHSVAKSEGLRVINQVDIDAVLVMDSTIVDYDSQVYYLFVPASFVVGGDEGGSGSGSDGLGNVASTLVKLVPLLLIVGVLLIFVMPMIYKPN